MHCPEDFSTCKILFERPHDDLPCCECDERGPIIVITDLGGRTYDLCCKCALRHGLRC